MEKYIASVSFGKDSGAMLLEILKRGLPLDEVVFYNNGMEFEAIYKTRDKILPLLDGHNIRYTEIKPPNPFSYYMLDVPRSDGRQGLAWCGGPCRWGAGQKMNDLDKYVKSKNAKVYVGIASDEAHRKERKEPYKLFPMIEWGMPEAAALQLCYDNGFDWMQDNIRLYDILDRVSCWCCRNKNLKELRNIYHYLPQYWERLQWLQSKIDMPFKGIMADKKAGIEYPVGIFELEKRFILEDQYQAAGLSIRNRKFFGDLKTLWRN